MQPLGQWPGGGRADADDDHDEKNRGGQLLGKGLKCRKRELAVDLLRLAAVSDRPGDYAVTVDSAGNLPGRGAWLHPDPQCLDVARRRRAIGRALRITGSPDTTAVEELFHRLENR